MDPKLYVAAAAGDLSFLEHTSEKQPDNLKVLLKQLSRPKLNTVLHVAASSGSRKFAEFISRHCLELIEKKNLRGDTALHIAARAGHFNLLEFLIEWAEEFVGSFSTEGETGEEEQYSCVLLGIPNKEGNTALHEAVRSGNTNVVELLMRADPQSALIVNNNKESPLYLAADRGLLPIVQKLLDLQLQDTRQSIICGGPNGQTPLHAAITRGHIEIIKVLVEKKQEFIRERDDNERTPLQYAASFGCIKGVPHLLKYDTSGVYQKDEDGLYPIHMAATKGHVDMIQMLLEYCPDSRDLLSREDQNVLHVAAKSGREKVVMFILNAPKLHMLINETDKKGNTPLHLATIHWHPKIVSLLTRYKVDMSITNDEGLTALDVAEKHIDTPASFRKFLTVTALRIVRAPRGQHQPVVVEGYDREGSMLGDKAKMEYYRDRINTLVLVAALVATVTFAAGFTMPGGYNNDGPNQGMATLLTKPTFHVFVISNTIAMYISITVVVTLIWAQLGDFNLLVSALRLSMPLLGFALTMMTVAFAAGVYLAVSKLRWLAYVVLVMDFIFTFCVLALFVPLHIQLWSKYRGVRCISYAVFRLVIFAIGHKLADLDS